MTDTLTYPDTPLEEAVVVRVVDGDTLLVEMAGDPTREHFRVRLVGIDTPESVAPEEWRNTDEGAIASTATHELVPAGARVWLQRDVSDIDEYGRMLRYVWLSRPDDPGSTGEVRRRMLNALLVERGMARVRRYEPDTTLHEYFSALGQDAIDACAGVTHLWAE